jgi:hypothetical protein
MINCMMMIKDVNITIDDLSHCHFIYLKIQRLKWYELGVQLRKGNHTIIFTKIKTQQLHIYGCI